MVRNCCNLKAGLSRPLALYVIVLRVEANVLYGSCFSLKASDVSGIAQFHNVTALRCSPRTR